MSPKPKPQSHMDETVIEDAELEKVLEDRQALKESVAQYRKLDKQAKEKLRSIETPTPFRVGRFVISRQVSKPRLVEFQTEEGLRFTIKLAGED